MFDRGCSLPFAPLNHFQSQNVLSNEENLKKAEFELLSNEFNNQTETKSDSSSNCSALLLNNSYRGKNSRVYCYTNCSALPLTEESSHVKPVQLVQNAPHSDTDSDSMRGPNNNKTKNDTSEDKSNEGLKPFKIKLIFDPSTKLSFYSNNTTSYVELSSERGPISITMG